MTISQNRNRRILIVDDMPKNLQIIGTILREKGFLISIAGSGKQALKVVKLNPPDLILLDTMMPEMDGFETCRRLKTNSATKDIPVIFLSTLSDTLNKVHGFKVGAVDYIIKPIESEELLARINTHLTIKHLYRELEKANVRLEKKVRLRTRKLESELRQRRQTEEEMKRLRNLLSNIINSMPSVLVGVDSEGKITQWNREAEKTTGMTAREVQGRDLAHAFPQLAEEMDKIRQAIGEHRILKDEKRLSNAGDEQRISDVTIYPLEGGDFEGAVIRIDDVTDRIRVREMMIQTEKMISLGGLAAGMAHEINNPLAGMLQNIQVIRNRISGDLPKNRRAAEECGITMDALVSYMEHRDLFGIVDSVIKSGLRAAQIVKDMLSFSRMSISEFKPRDLGELLDKTVDIATIDYDLKKRYDFKQIEIIREYDRNLPQILCDGSKIQQVFLNILKNGAHAMAEEKTQTDNGKSPRFILRLMAEGNMARIEIEDNGPGMDEPTRKRVFEPFFTTKEVGIGTGLGLSVSYFIITKNHGGTMAVESAPGKGAKFIIRLPIKNASGDLLF